MTGLGIDLVRPKSSGSTQYLDHVRPSTSGSMMSMGSSRDRRKSAGSGFLRGKLNALTNRLKDRDGDELRGREPEDE